MESVEIQEGEVLGAEEVTCGHSEGETVARTPAPTVPDRASAQPPSEELPAMSSHQCPQVPGTGPFSQ